MQQKPFGSNFDFYDGEWMVPMGILSASTLFGDYEWTKMVLMLMFIVFSFHILFEHKVAFGTRDIFMKRIYTIVAFIASVFISLLMPIYAAISYAMCASQLKKEKEDALLLRKRKTYVTMMCILVFAVAVHAWQNFLLIDDLQAAIENQNTQGMDGTISQ